MANYNFDNERVLADELGRFQNMIGEIEAKIILGIRRRKQASGLSQSTRNEIDSDVLSKVGGFGGVAVQEKVVIELLKNTTPHVYRWEDKDETDGLLRKQGKFYKVSDDTLAFDPEAL